MKLVKELTMELVEPASFSAARPSVFVGKTRRSNWVAREQSGSLAGLLNRAQALEYALFETRDHPETIGRCHVGSNSIFSRALQIAPRGARSGTSAA
ncbi:hypothetical protein [Bradyrhizobium sp. CCBAU 21359]|uniref:hypothetical protein n=1 Tax=Bradyrhizobium sp. CCBAU 21359 TaxID=1325080 RepID=UPI002305F398|nr:hypothetical protein [Bradyrhizobium sp. CCBAU 21359]